MVTDLIHKTIVSVRYMTDQEKQAFGWTKKSLVIQLNDGTVLFASRDEEGNDAGTFFLMDNNDQIHPITPIN